MVFASASSYFWNKAFLMSAPVNSVIKTKPQQQYRNKIRRVHTETGEVIYAMAKDVHVVIETWL